MSPGRAIKIFKAQVECHERNSKNMCSLSGCFDCPIRYQIGKEREKIEAMKCAIGILERDDDKHGE